MSWLAQRCAVFCRTPPPLPSGSSLAAALPLLLSKTWVRKGHCHRVEHWLCQVLYQGAGGVVAVPNARRSGCRKVDSL